jgi:hypothetical protein
MRASFLFIFLVLSSAGVFAQSLYYPDCMLGALGMRVADSTTRQILANSAIYLQASDSTKKEVMNSEKRIAMTKSLVEFGDAFTKETGIQLRYAGLPFIRSMMATEVSPVVLTGASSRLSLSPTKNAAPRSK